jgi:ABC-type multidrug transport system ATPase subunit
VNLTKSLLNDPELILMDEPTASLDPDIADKTLTWIEELRADRNLSILFTSHNMAEVERICDEIVFLEKGKIISRGTPADHTSKINKVEIVLTYKGSQPDLQQLLDKNKISYDFSPRGVVTIESKKAKTAEIISLITGAGFDIADTEIKKPDLEQVFLEIARNKP